MDKEISPSAMGVLGYNRDTFCRGVPGFKLAGQKIPHMLWLSLRLSTLPIFPKGNALVPPEPCYPVLATP